MTNPNITARQRHDEFPANRGAPDSKNEVHEIKAGRAAPGRLCAAASTAISASSDLSPILTRRLQVHHRVWAVPQGNHNEPPAIPSTSGEVPSDAWPDVTILISTPRIGHFNTPKRFQRGRTRADPTFRGWPAGRPDAAVPGDRFRQSRARGSRRAHLRGVDRRVTDRRRVAIKSAEAC